jgi:hypothetical protein
MNHNSKPQPETRGTQPSKETLDLARTGVRALLENTPSFRALSATDRQQIASDTVNLVAYLAEPEGVKATALPAPVNKPAENPALPRKPDAYSFALAGGSTSTSSSSGDGKFTAQAAAEGARVAGVYLEAVNFPKFVSSLISGVFHSIVESSIEQMHAYGQLVADVAKTLNQFRDENVTDNQGRDYLIQQFPDTFKLDIDTGDGGAAAPRVRMRDGVDEDQALKKVNSLPLEGGPVTSLDDDSIEGKLVPAARTQLATSRQQLLATMVLMGINRIVVTDGRIAAKVLFDFQAKDNFKFQKSATSFDYGDQYAYTSTGEFDTQTQGAERSRSSSKDSSESDDRDASYYSKGKYQNTAQPVLKLMTASQARTDAALTTKASLSGSVEVNFKSETFPLEKMADSFQIGQIQNAAKPGQAKPAAAGKTAPLAPAATTPPPAQTPAAQHA